MTDSVRFSTGGQILGRRQRQEDEYGICALPEAGPNAVLMVVADGMGGHAGGRECAQAAVAAFTESFIQSKDDISGRLQAALDAANAAIATLKDTDPVLEEGGCTLVGATANGKTVSWISVGDSSLLRFRDGRMERLNADHSMRPILMDLVATGRMTEEELDHNPHRNALRSAVSGQEIELVDLCCDLPLEAGDTLLLASDGLDVLAPEAVGEIVGRAGNGLRDTVAALLQAVENRAEPRQDNTTVVLYREPSAPARSSKNARPAQYRLRRVGIGVVLLCSVAIGLWWLTHIWRGDERVPWPAPQIMNVSSPASKAPTQGRPKP